MCGMNLAFDRETIGPAMYFGLMGDGQPLGRYDDMWAGWCAKVGPAVPAAFVSLEPRPSFAWMHAASLIRQESAMRLVK